MTDPLYPFRRGDPNGLSGSGNAVGKSWLTSVARNPIYDECSGDPTAITADDLTGVRNHMLRSIGNFVVEAVERQPTRFALLFIVFLLFAGMDLGIGTVAAAGGLPFLEHESVDAIIHGALAVVAAWFLLEAARERRERIRAEIQQSAQLNHEIRNALEVIGHAGYLLNDVVYGKAVAESVDRIKKSLDRSKPDSGNSS